MEDQKDKAISLLNRAESTISNAREVMDDKKLFHLTGELLAVDTILSKILRSQRQTY